MEKRHHIFWNNVTGWFIFTIALIVYLSTIEPSTSFWDTGEFIAAAYKLQVVHPPGAPLFLMINRLATFFAPSSGWVAPMVNTTSALASAFTILFLFWTITGLASRLSKSGAPTNSPLTFYTILGGGIIGSLAFTFTDTFWFSATEGEVYALSTFFMALVLWLMLKWETRAHQRKHLKYLILIAYLLGLSIGVHLLSLLVIPALAFIYYFRNYRPTWLGGLITAITGIGILGLINFGFIRWFPSLAASVELSMVNQLHFPLWSGIFLTLVMLLGLLLYGIFWSYKNQRILMNTIFLSLTAILIGYSSYAMVVIRSKADPSIDINNPESVFNLKSYLNREQYGSRPLIYGPYFNAKVRTVDKGSPQYLKGEDRYENLGSQGKPVYRNEDKTLFPRMGDQTRQSRAKFYRQWEDLDKGETPSFANNLHFFFTYQVGHMWWRYFAWNFIGRQNDYRGTGQDYHKGNWLTGIPFIDRQVLGLGAQESLPDKFRSNPARNYLYGLPFLLGLLGFLIHFKYDPKRALPILVFFFMTGIGLIIYLNNPPLEPRERDYTSVGSFYAFAIWIGMGAFGILDWINMRWSRILTMVGFVILLGLPALMAQAEWDDHDRSGRYFARNHAYNYLTACDSNAVLFTSGDNETYPIWYLQQVEGIRKDIRVVNTSLLGMGWYQEQLREAAHGAKGLDFGIPNQKVRGEKMQRVIYKQHPDMDPEKHYNLKRIIAFIASDDQQTKVVGNKRERRDFLPTKKLSIPVDAQKVLKNGTVEPQNQKRIVDKVKFQYPRGQLSKSDLLLLGFIAKNNWNRPVYFSSTAGRNAYAGLSNYFRCDGLVYRLVPIPEGNDPDDQDGWVNPQITQQHVLNEFQFGNLPESSIYVDNVMRKQCRNYRNLFNRLAIRLIENNQNNRAVNVLDKSREVLPREKVPYDLNSLYTVSNYYSAGATEKGKSLAKKLSEAFAKQLRYFLSMDRKQMKQVSNTIENKLYSLNQMRKLAKANNQNHFAQKLQKQFNRFNKQYKR